MAAESPSSGFFTKLNYNEINCDPIKKILVELEAA